MLSVGVVISAAAVVVMVPSNTARYERSIIADILYRICIYVLLNIHPYITFCSIDFNGWLVRHYRPTFDRTERHCVANEERKQNK